MPVSADTDELAAANPVDAGISPALVPSELAPDHPNAFACLAAAQGMAGDITAADATVAAA